MNTPDLIKADSVWNEEGDMYSMVAEFQCDATLVFMENWAAAEHPAHHCTHEHDCCGNFYPRSPTVTQIGINRFMVVQNYYQNI